MPTHKQLQVAQLVIKDGKSIAQAARELGVSTTSARQSLLAGVISVMPELESDLTDWKPAGPERDKLGLIRSHRTRLISLFSAHESQPCRYCGHIPGPTKP